jgi:hypothetical protein
MRRREFIILLGGVSAAWPGSASAQAEKPIRIGMLPFGSPSNDYDKSLVEAFRLGLAQRFSSHSYTLRQPAFRQYLKTKWTRPSLTSPI